MNLVFFVALFPLKLNEGCIAGVIPDEVVRDLYVEPVLDRLTKKIRGFIRDGYSGDQLLTQLLQIVIDDDSITDVNKAKLLEKIAVNYRKYLFPQSLNIRTKNRPLQLNE